MPNPLDYVTKQDILDLELSPEELLTAYQPSGGGYYHARGAEGIGKTVLISHIYKYIIDSGELTPFDATGNLTFKGKYGKGFTTLKGQELFEYLLWFSDNLPRNKIVIVSEIDREFPARFFSSKEQTKIALAMWEIQKIHSYFLADSHLGNSTDLIFHLSSHYTLYPFPNGINWEAQTLDFTLVNNLECWTDDFTAYNIVKTMLIYNRCETTVVSEHRIKREKSETKSLDNSNDYLDFEAELKGLNLA